jgi:hypothetical protein
VEVREKCEENARKTNETKRQLKKEAGAVPKVRWIERKCGRRAKARKKHERGAREEKKKRRRAKCSLLREEAGGHNDGSHCCERQLNLPPT